MIIRDLRAVDSEEESSRRERGVTNLFAAKKQSHASGGEAVSKQHGKSGGKSKGAGTEKKASSRGEGRKKKR